jgi:hypothetical protein
MLPLSQAMRTITRAAHPVEEPVAARVIRWNFVRGGHALTCEVDVRGAEQFDVCIVPHWNVSASVIESFDREFRALERHAEIALQLREAGWITNRPAA